MVASLKDHLQAQEKKADDSYDGVLKYCYNCTLTFFGKEKPS